MEKQGKDKKKANPTKTNLWLMLAKLSMSNVRSLSVDTLDTLDTLDALVLDIIPAENRASDS